MAEPPVLVVYLKYKFFFFFVKRAESSNLCENTRACLDPQLKYYGSIDFTLTYLSAETRVNEAQTIDTTLVHKREQQTIKVSTRVREDRMQTQDNTLMCY